MEIVIARRDAMHCVWRVEKIFKKDAGFKNPFQIL